MALRKHSLPSRRREPRKFDSPFGPAISSYTPAWPACRTGENAKIRPSGQAGVCTYPLARPTGRTGICINMYIYKSPPRVICRQHTAPSRASGQPRSVIIIVLADGRCCAFCGVKDSASDPVDAALRIVNPENGAAITMAWYTGKPKHGILNEGRVCFYCYAVFQSRYKLTGKTGV